MKTERYFTKNSTPGPWGLMADLINQKIENPQNNLM